MNNRQRVKEILKVFDKEYGTAECSLKYDDPLQLLIATQLAAQCTDERVNKVTPALFKKYEDVYAFAVADLSELEGMIRSTGFYHNKARNIINCCKAIIEKHEGKVPKTMDELLLLAGVGRKTANLVLGDAFGVPGIVIDTHAKRLSNRIGLTKNEDPEKIEYDLMEIVPKESWSKFCHQLVYHGRAVCTARKPLCDVCKICMYCDFGKLSR